MTHVLAQILVVLAASLGAVWVVARGGLPSIVGYLLAGIVIGPHGVGLVADMHLIEGMAEIGVVLLMFTIGLKFSVAELKHMRGLVFGAGASQMVITIAAVAALTGFGGMPLPRGIFIGLLVAMSSTAIVLKLLEERAETESPHGRVAVGVSIFQDLAVVPAILVTPMLAGQGGSPGQAVFKLLWSLSTVVAILIAAKLALPRFFAAIAKTRSREMFTLATFLVVLTTAAATGAAGLSLALGALVAGVVLSESDYANQVLSDVVPLRDLLASLFFVSVGMLVNVGDWFHAPVLTFGLAAAVVVVKGLIVWGVARMFHLSWRVAVLAGISLSQVGEFSFVLALTGRDLLLLDAGAYQVFLSVTVLSMVATPLLLQAAPWIISRGRPAPKHTHVAPTPRSGHVIVVGYGVAGRNVVSVLRPLGAPVVVLELNQRTVAAIRAAGADAEFGDACSESVLLHVGIRTARALVLTAVDPFATRQAVATARRLNPEIEILVRTRFVGEIAELHRLGATSVVPEEFEASIALAGLTMRRFGASEQAVSRAAAALRGDDYALLADTSNESITDTRRAHALARVLAVAEFADVPIPDGAVGATLRGLDLRTRTGALAVALRRGGEVVANPAPDLPFERGDVLVLLGMHSSLQKVHEILSGRGSAGTDR
ncbi:MAG: cation:proton antiporter [Planctomycetes bacterium]|nr:cation:proton antiporter [Planctomycetota bacterium]